MTTTTKERPILFSGPMVRAILDGRKTQTRRVVKPQPCQQMVPVDFTLDQSSRRWSDRQSLWNCPYGRPGDRLWVREAWAADRCYDHLKPCEIPEGSTIHRGEEIVSGWHKKRPSIHMPRWASRIDLEVTGVRVERLQDISERDAKSEGVWPLPPNPPIRGHQRAFKALWGHINGSDSWAKNPWVWVVEFRRIGGAS